MNKKKLSGPAVFMYSTIILMVILSVTGFTLYYTGIYESDVVLWVGIVAFMIIYHFGLRLLEGVITNKFNISYNHPWYKTRKFEKKLYRILKVRLWKDKVLTFEPDKYDFKSRTLHELATTMAKSELDHWINEAISVFSLFFIFVWGCAPAFIITAVLAMIFDAQFIVVQRYNRPIVLRLMKAKKKKNNKSIKTPLEA